MTSVLIADFQYLTRKGIQSLVNALPGYEVIRMLPANSGLELAIEELDPQIVIIDVSLEDNGLMDRLERIKNNYDTSFLVISNNQNKESIQHLLGMGIKGILTKNCSEEEIINGLNAVAQGNRFFCNNILDLVIDSQENRDDCEPTLLSPREYEVLELITQGMTTAQIADKLSLSIHTINSHRKNILRKLNLSSPTELVVYAFESGLVKKS